MVTRGIIIIGLMGLLVALAFSQSSWKGTASTDWKNPANWTNGVPSATIDAIIGDEYFTGSFQPSVTSRSYSKSLIIGVGSKASILTLGSPNRHLTVSGDITIGVNGTINHSKKSKLSLSGNWNNSGTYSATDKNVSVVFTGVAQSLNGATAFKKLIINAGSTTTINANVNVTTLTVNGTCDPSGSGIIITGSSFVVNSGGSIRIKASTLTGNYNISSFTINGGSTVDYAATAIDQTVSNLLTYSTLRISGGMTKTLVGNLPALNSSSSATGNVFVESGTLNLSTFTANRGTTVAGGNFTVANGATLRVGGTNSFSSNYSNILLATTSTIEYTGTYQTVSLLQYGNLTLSSSSGAIVKTMPVSPMTIAGNFVSAVGSGTHVSFTAGNNINFDGDVTIGSSTTFNGSSYVFNVKSNWTNQGTFVGGSGKVILQGTNKVISGVGLNNFNDLEITGPGITIPGTVNISASGDLTAIGAGTLTHASGGTITMTGSGKNIIGAGLTINNLSITNSITASTSLTITGDLSLSGSGSFSATAGIITMSGLSKTIFNSGSGSLIFNGLSVTGNLSTSAAFSMRSDFSVTGSFTATDGIVSFIGTSTLSGTAYFFDVILNGTKLQLGGNATLEIASTLTLTAGIFDVTSTTPNTVNYNAIGVQSVLATTYHNLSISGSGTKSAAGALTINGHMVINSGVTFDGGSFTHIIYGNWKNDGSFIATSSTIQFSGALDASISGLSVTTFNIVTLDKPQMGDILTLNTSAIIGTLNMFSGKMIVPDTSQSVTITSTRGGDGIIIGKITRTHTFSNSIAYAFESPHNVITFTGGGVNPGSVTVKVTLGGPSDFVPANTTVDRTYEITQTGGAGYTATCRIHYDDNELNGNEEAMLHLWRYDGSLWVDFNKTSNDQTNNWVEKAGIDDIMGRWTLYSKISGVVDWIGSVSSAWENASNWAIVSGNPTVPPDDTTLVQLGFVAFTNQPLINSTVSIRSLSLGSAQAVTLTISSGSLNIGGSTGNLSGSFTADISHIVQVGDQTLSIGGNLLLSDGTLNRRINLSLGSGSIIIGGRIDHTANSDISITGTGTMTVAGDWIRASSATFNSGTGTVIYNGNSNQAVIGGIDYYNLNIKKPTGTATISSSATVKSDLVIDSTAGIFQVSAPSLLIGGNVIIGSGTTLDATSSAITVGGNWTRNGTFNPGGGTITFDGTGVQTVTTTTFGNLVINKPTGTLNLTGDLVLNGNLSLISGTVDLNTYLANRSAFGGTMTIGAGGVLKIGTGSNLPEYFSVHSLDPTSTVEYYGTNMQTLPAITYGNIILSNGGDNGKSLSGTITVNGNLLTNNGATLIANSFTMRLNGDWTKNGTFTEGTGRVIFAGSGKSADGATNFDLNDVSVPGSYTFSGNELYVKGNLDVTGTLDVGSAPATIDGDLTNSGVLISNGITTFSGTRAQVIRLMNALTSASTGVVNFNGSVRPIMNSTSSPTFATLNINNIAGVAPSIGWNVTGPLTVASNSAFIGGSSTHNFYDSFTNNGIVTSSGTFNFIPPSAKTISLHGIEFTSTGIVNFGGTGGLTITGSHPSFTTLNITNTSGNGVTASSDWNIGSNFTVGTEAIFHAGNGLSHRVSGTLTNNGSFDGGASTFILDNPTGGEITGGGRTTFNNLTIAGIISGLSDFDMSGDFTNNGTFDGSGIDVSFIGSSSSTILGSTSPTSFPSILNMKSNAVTTLGINLIDVVSLYDSTGTFDLSSFTVTQDVTGGILTISDGAILKVGGSESLPTFSTYNFGMTSTVDYNGAASQTVSSTPTYGTLKVSTSGTKTAGGPFIVRNAFDVSNVIFADDGNTVSVNGNFSNTGAHSGSGKILLTGAANIHSLSGNGSYSNIEVDDALGVTIADDPTINGTLTLRNGKIFTGAKKVIVSSTGNVNRVNGHIAGNLQKYIPTGAVTNVFEIGDTSAYRPIDVAFGNVTAGGYLTGRVSQENGDHPTISTSGIDATKSVNRYWTLNAEGGVTFSAYNATFTFINPGDLDGAANTNNFVVRRYSGGSWLETTAGTRTSTSTQATDLLMMSDFAVGELTTFLLTVQAGANGSITTPVSSPVTVNYGVATTITASASSGYHFVDWTNPVGTAVIADANAASTTATLSVGDATVQANFALNQYQLTVSSGTGGSITAPPTSPVTVDHSVATTITASANSGYRFVNWTNPVGTAVIADVNLISTTATLSAGDATVQANFAINTYTLTYMAGANGSITGSSPQTVNHGSDGTAVTAVPDLNYHFVNWSDTSTANPRTDVNVIEDINVTANFALNQYQLTVTTGTGGSITTPATSPVTVDHGAATTITALENSGYHFVNWTNPVGTAVIADANLISTTATLSVGDAIVQANFALNQYQLTVATGTGGSITAPATSPVTVVHGVATTITASENSGYHFVNWTNPAGTAVIANANLISTTVTLSVGDATVQANFATTIYQLTVQASTGGTITTPASSPITVGHGVATTITALANSGYHFVNWTNPVGTAVIADANAISTTATLSAGDATVLANFAITTYQLRVQASTGGSITAPSTSPATVNHGVATTITASANTGYHFVNWTNPAGTAVIANASIASTTVTLSAGDATVQANFTINTYTLTYIAGLHGSITGTSPQTVTHGANGTAVTAVPDPTYHFVNWSDLSTANPRTDVNVIGNITVTANFAANPAPTTYQITTSVHGNGTITPSGIITLDEGENQQFTFAPNVGSHFDSLLVDGTRVDSTHSYTFTNIQANHAISVYFSLNTYTLTFGTVGSGSITKNPDQTNYDYGTVVQLIAHPQSGWVFGGWSGDATGMTNPLDVTMNSDKSITATFTEDPDYQVMYRSFMQESLAVSKDNKNKWGKYVNPLKPDKVDFAFELAPIAPVTVTFKFSMYSSGVITQGSDTLGKWLNAKTVTSLAVTTVGAVPIHVEGRGFSGKLIKVDYKWATLPKATRGKVITFIQNQLRLPMPNRVNALYNTFYGSGYGVVGMVVGEIRIDSVKNYGWFQTLKYGDVMKTLYMPRIATIHTGTPRGFDVYINGKPMTKRNKKLLPTKHNNKLLADLIALKFNITASAMKYIPVGFGELIFDDGTTNPLNGMMVKEVAEYADSLIMGWLVDTTYFKSTKSITVKAHHFADASKFMLLDTVVAKINSAFEGTIDTTSFGDSLRFTGVKKLIDIPYLKPSVGIIPAEIIPLAGMYKEEEPVSYALYQNYPNPFNPTTTIQFDLVDDALVTLKVYDVLGQEVATLFDREELNGGTQEVQFNAAELASGVYFYRIVAEQMDDEGVTLGTFQTVKKMMLLK